MRAAQGIGAVAAAIEVCAAKQAPHRRPDPSPIFVEVDRQLPDPHLAVANIDRVEVLAEVGELLRVGWRGRWVVCVSPLDVACLAAGAKVRFDRNSPPSRSCRLDRRP